MSEREKLAMGESCPVCGADVGVLCVGLDDLLHYRRIRKAEEYAATYRMTPTNSGSTPKEPTNP